jgi:hypothetical protein
MTAKVGDGSVANQTYRVYVGQVTVAGGVTTAITWYQLQGKYKSTTAAWDTTTSTHKLGILPANARAIAVCRVATGSFSVGDEVELNVGVVFGGGWGIATSPLRKTLTTIQYVKGHATYNYVMTSANSGINVTSANWDLRLEAERGW